jgi:GNAT superfamily N-acetyltransferase
MNFARQLRSPNPSDLPFIINSWTESYKDSKYNPIYGPAYFYYFRLLLNRLIPKSLITVICNPDDPDQIYGWGCYTITDNQLIVHWIYIKYTFRKLGLGTFLLNTLKEMVKSDELIITLKPCYYDRYKDTFKHKYEPKRAFE